MAIKHDSIIPYVDIDGLCFNAFVINRNYITFTIFSKHESAEIYRKRWKKSELIKKIESGSAKALSIEDKLPKADFSAAKEEILDYLKNLEKYYAEL